MVEEKKPAVNLAELLKETGIVDDDSFFMEEEPLAPVVVAPPQPLPTPQVQIQMDPPPPPLPAVATVETKENNVMSNIL